MKDTLELTRQVAAAALWCLAGVMAAFVVALFVLSGVEVDDRVAGVVVLVVAAVGLAAGGAMAARRNPDDGVFTAVAGVLVLDTAGLGLAALSGGPVVDGTAAFLLQQAVLFGAAAAGAGLARFER